MVLDSSKKLKGRVIEYYINQAGSKTLRNLESLRKESESRSVMSNTLRPHGLNSPGQSSGVGSLSLLQGIFPTQGSSPGLSHCRRILYQLSHLEPACCHKRSPCNEKPILCTYRVALANREYPRNSRVASALYS